MKTIVWDIDDVLNNLTKDWFEREWLMTHPECNIKYIELFSNPPYAILNMKIQEYLKSLDDFRNLHGKELKPTDEVYSWFQSYGVHYRHIILTSTPLFYTPFSFEWIFRNFGKWIRSYNFVPSPRENSNAFNYDVNKASFLKLFTKVDLFIDDNENNIEEACAIGINGVLMPRPWNKSTLTIDEFIYNLNNLYL